MTIRVIQWGAGKNGCALIRAIADHESLELVGCRVYSDSKHGLDAGELAGIAPLGISATTDRQSLIDMDADVVIHCPRLTPDMTGNDKDVTDLLHSGKNVISVSGAHSYPWAFPGYAEPFEEACRAGHSRFAHTGVNPGFICERLAPTLTGLCTRVKSLTAAEAYNCENSTADILFETQRFGLPLEEWTADSPVGGMFNHVFVQLVHNMARPLGVELRDVRHSARVVPAHRDIHVAGRTVKVGSVAAIVQRWEGIPEDEDQVRVAKETSWMIAADIPDHPVKSGWQIHVEGIPSLDMELRMSPEGDVTYEPECMVGAAIPMIPELLAAPPGILLPRVFAPYKKVF